MIVTLTAEQCDRADSQGASRYDDARRRGYCHRGTAANFKEDVERFRRQNMYGRRGEIAVEVGHGLPPTPELAARRYAADPDVWGCQVRTLGVGAKPYVSQRMIDNYCLLIREIDIIQHPDSPYCLVLPVDRTYTTYRLVGYLPRAAFARRDEWWGNKGEGRTPCWWVPQEFLLPPPFIFPEDQPHVRHPAHWQPPLEPRLDTRSYRLEYQIDLPL